MGVQRCCGSPHRLPSRDPSWRTPRPPLAILLGENGLEKAVLIGSILLVLVVELINSAIETTVDRVGTEKNELSRKEKDLASTAVLFSLVNLLLVWELILVD